MEWTASSRSQQARRGRGRSPRPSARATGGRPWLTWRCERPAATTSPSATADLALEVDEYDVLRFIVVETRQDQVLRSADANTKVLGGPSGSGEGRKPSCARGAVSRVPAGCSFLILARQTHPKAPPDEKEGAGVSRHLLGGRGRWGGPPQRAPPPSMRSRSAVELWEIQRSAQEHPGGRRSVGQAGGVQGKELAEPGEPRGRGRKPALQRDPWPRDHRHRDLAQSSGSSPAKRWGPARLSATMIQTNFTPGETARLEARTVSMV